MVDRDTRIEGAGPCEQHMDLACSKLLTVIGIYTINEIMLPMFMAHSHVNFIQIATGGLRP